MDHYADPRFKFETGGSSIMSRGDARQRRVDTSVTVGNVTFKVGDLKVSDVRLNNFICSLNGGLDDELKTSDGRLVASRCELRFEIPFGRATIHIPKEDHGRIISSLQVHARIEPLELRCGVKITQAEDRYRIKLRIPEKINFNISERMLKSLNDAIVNEKSNEFVEWSGWQIQSQLIMIPRALFTEFSTKVSAMLGELEKLD